MACRPIDLVGVQKKSSFQVTGVQNVAIVLPDEGLADQLSYIIKTAISGVADWQLMLFQNNLTPTQTTVFSDLVEATFSGYSRVTVTRATWTSPTIVADKAVSTWGTTGTTWTNAGSTQTIYGYALITASSPVIRVIERFASPVVMATGGIISVLPSYNFTTAP